MLSRQAEIFSLFIASFLTITVPVNEKYMGCYGGERGIEYT